VQIGMKKTMSFACEIKVIKNKTFFKYKEQYFTIQVYRQKKLSIADSINKESVNERKEEY
jgi:hypothetical protein